MVDQYVPDDVRDFIQMHINSVVQIEALLLIRSDSQQRWSTPQIAARLYVSESEAQEALERLCSAGLLDCESEFYRIDRVSSKNTTLIDRLLAAYTHHLIPVTNIIHAKPRRPRSFAEVFRFRKSP